MSMYAVVQSMNINGEIVDQQSGGLQLYNSSIFMESMKRPTFLCQVKIYNHKML
jgi:hypothetical protein